MNSLIFPSLYYETIETAFPGVLVTMIVVLVFIFIYRDDDIDPMPDFPPGLSQEEKVKIVQKKYQRIEEIDLDSPEATNLFKRLVQEEVSILIPLQNTCWKKDSPLDFTR